MSRPMMDDGSAVGAGPPPPAPGGAPGETPPSMSPQMQALAQISLVLKRFAQSDPRLSAGLMKAVQGIQEAQTAGMTGGTGQGPALEQTPPQ